ncbi:MAG: hypothetical protein IJI45_10435 [Anaerolineaceae bacterium]|nr:hypothetical protein [Oscillospiraceae bacterium]MBQ6481523.1 hypothetical protein [Anaerolineaceae bacterium]
MAVIIHHFYSSALTECNSMTVIVPVEKAERTSYPVLWLIPPFGGDHTAWLRHTNMERLAEENAFMIVMPDMKLSFGTDMVHGFKYHTMLTKELPQVLCQVYPADLSQQMIAGAKEGAYTALYSSLTCEGQYRKTIALSCGSLTDENLPKNLQKPFFYAFGTDNMADLSNTDYDVCSSLDSWKDLDTWFLAWSCKDTYHSSCERLSSYLRAGSVKEYKGASFSWKEWESVLKDVFNG